MDIIIDTNVLRKLYGFHNNHKNTDKAVNIEKLYNAISNDRDFNVFLPRECFIEVLSNPNYNSKIKEMFYFLNDLNIKVLFLNVGIKEFHYDRSEIKDLDIERMKKEILEEKIKFEKQEIVQFFNIFVYVINYIIIDTINYKLSLKDLYTDDIKDNIFQIYDDGYDHILELANKKIDKVLRDAYKTNEAKDKTKEFINLALTQYVYEILHLFKNEKELTNIILEEIDLFEKYDNKLEYLKTRISHLKKWYKLDNYLKVIEKRYLESLEGLGYPLFYNKFLVNLMNLHLTCAKFSKNDSTDSAIFLYHNENKYVLSFDNVIKNFLKANDLENYNFIKLFEK